MAGLKSNSKTVYTKGDRPSLPLPVPHPRGEPLPASPRLHRRQFWFSLPWGHCSFPLGLGTCKILFVPSKMGVSVSPSPLTFQGRFPGDSQSLCQLPSLRKPDTRFKTFTTVGELLRYYCFPAGGSPTQWVLALI